MSVHEIISVVLSSIAVIISGFAFWRVRKTSSANIELTINSTITASKDRVSDIGIRVAEIKGDSDNRDKVMKQAYRAALENNLNAYEEACAKYIDNKVDKARFKKMYVKEIRQLFGSPSYKEYLDSVASPYNAIRKVFNEWENLEK